MGANPRNPPADAGAANQAQPAADWKQVQPKWTLWHSLSLLLIVVAIGALNLVPGAPAPRVVFLITLGLMALFTAIAGNGVVGLWYAVFIDERNKLSLARLQMALWTILVLSGFLTAALHNVAVGETSPLAIDIPQQMWILMGITTTSLVASPLILGLKSGEVSNAGLSPEANKKIEDEKKRTEEELIRQGLEKDDIAWRGKIVIWKWPWDARLADLFQGDEIIGGAQLDLGKVQLFFFTFVLVLTYAVSLYSELSGGAAIHKFPPVHDSMVALLGISHAGFLTNKAVPRG